MKLAHRRFAPIAAALLPMVAGLPAVKAQEIAVSRAATPAKSAAKPSNSMDRPTPLPLGEIVNGRADGGSKTNKIHYWAFDLPAGEYKVVLDMERSDRRNSNIQGSLRWLGTGGEDLGRLGHFNEIDYRARQVGVVKLEKPTQGVLAVEPEQMVDYDLAIFRADSKVPVPLLRGTPPVTPIEFGQLYKSPLLDGSSAKAFACYTSITLPAGDYRITYSLTREDGQSSNIQGYLKVLDPDGVVVQRLGNINAINSTATAAIDIVLSEEKEAILRIDTNQKARATLKVERRERD
ncbi:MAG: hypothetical protein U0800_11250 [Isosphaeraceae bacterium]